ncbi:OmpH family outer membrane protein [Pectinatus frisingensis]|uniref:OmpH family outer membrane protein n=1 Tax=Pectinatus frisingensis TaxID=865 RepID=UPI0018C73A6D|nr:OmpH family outer membrane protein [Pectinatus frisingensis]
MKHRMKMIFLAGAVIMVAAVLLAGCSNKAKIGYVDISRVAAESPQVQSLNQNFEKEYKPLADQMETLAKQQDSMSKEDYTKEVQQLQRKAYGIQQKYNAQRQDLVNKVLARISKEKGLSAVTTKASFAVDPEVPVENSVSVDGVVVDGGTDITDEVIQKLQ